MGKPSPKTTIACPSCGGPFQVTQARLDAGRGRFCSRACGTRFHGTVHGHTSHAAMSPTYTSWLNMRQRCSNPKKPKYQVYGAAGIGIDASWSSFETFLKDMGERPDGKTLDRWPDKAGDYGPRNCRWASPQEQSENTRTTSFVMFRGEQISMSALARLTGVSKTTLRYRISVGRSDDALARPANYGPRSD